MDMTEGTHMDNTLLASLRAITEDDITAALQRAYVQLPITDAAEAVELVQCILDHVTGERARVEAEDEARVMGAKHP